MTQIADPAPLAARVVPISGESLLSLIARAAHANVFPRLSALLAEAGVQGHPAFTPFTAGERITPLAALLGVSPQEVAERMHPPVPDAPKGAIDWSGVRIERRWVEARTRRVSPASLAISAHHRLVWTHRALSFCPESFEVLVDCCPACHAGLGWVTTRGPDRCDRCGASLVGIEPACVDPSLHSRLKLASDLISPDPEVRRRAQNVLPAEFQPWDAGELFTALVELGLAFEHPGEGRGSQVASALSEGRLGLVTPEILARGHELLEGWPDSFAELVERICRSRQRVDPNASVALRGLGLLGRHFESWQPDTAFYRLLRDDVVQAAIAAPAPLKLGHLGHLRRDVTSTTIGLAQASRLFNVAESALKRLVPDGESFVAGRLGRGGAVRFDRARLSASVERRRHAVDPNAVSVSLGVPAYCLPAFVTARLLRRIRDPDVARMAGVDVVYDRRSLQALTQRLTADSVEGDSTDLALAGVVAGLFAPRHWADAFQACLSGAIAIESVAERKGSLASRLLVDRSHAERFQENRPCMPQPRNVDLSPREAGLLLGTSDVAIYELIEEAHLPAWRIGPRWRIRLHDVMAFHDAYVIGPEMNQYAATGNDLPPSIGYVERPVLSI